MGELWGTSEVLTFSSCPPDLTKRGCVLSTLEKSEVVSLELDESSALNRRSFLKRASIAGAAGLALGGLLTSASARGENANRDSDDSGEDLNPRDRAILIAAEIAEALAVTTYTNIINLAPFFGNLA